MIEQVMNMLMPRQWNTSGPQEDGWAVFLRRAYESSAQTQFESVPVPPSHPEDAVLREGAEHQTPPGDEAASSHESPSQKVDKGRAEWSPTRYTGAESMRVFVTRDLEPGSRVRVRYPDGTALKMNVPPRSEWHSKNLYGRLQLFFLVPTQADSDPPVTGECVHLPESQESHFSDHAASVLLP